MKRVLIAGVGNILLGDDGVGPYVVRKLAANYVFEDGVELEDLGTPALDFIDHITGLDALIVVDAVNNGEPAGTITLYRKEDLTRQVSGVRMNPHSPALGESLLAAEWFGGSPKDVTLVGVSGESFSARCVLSEPVQAAVERAIRQILIALSRIGVGFVRQFAESPARTWWMRKPGEVQA